MKLAGIPYSFVDLKELFIQNKLVVGFAQVSDEKELCFYTPVGAKRASLNTKGWYQAHIKPTGYGYNDLNLKKLIKIGHQLQNLCFIKKIHYLKL